MELPELQKAIEHEVERLKTELVQPQELERISTRFVANLIYGQDDISRASKDDWKLSREWLELSANGSASTAF